MKIKLEKKFVQLGFTIFLTAIALMAVYFCVFRINSIKEILHSINVILMPVFYGFIMAYLMTPLLNAIEKKFVSKVYNKIKFLNNDKKKQSHIRGISILITIVIVLYLIYLFFSILIPQVYNSIQSIIKNYNKYTENLVLWLRQVMDNNPDLNALVSDIIVSYSSEADDFLNDSVLPALKNLLIPNLNDILLNLSSSIIKVFKLLYNFIIGLIISLYVLSSKEKFVSGTTKLCYAFLENKTANTFIDSARFTHKTFIGFLSGKVLDSAIIGVICYVCALFMKLPYPVLIAVIVGVTNIIPFFGPYFGAVPSAFIILMVDPKKALYFLILILVLQQFDGNFLGPKILSGSTGLSSFWIIFSITLFGGLFGVIGMVIGVPVTAVIFTGINKLTDNKLLKKNLPTDNNAYYDIQSINEDGTIVKYVYVKPEKEKKEESKLIIAIKLICSKIVLLFKKLFVKKDK